jgi:glucose-6-phosphate isomerase
MALLGVWHRNICDNPTHAILPYAQHLHRFPAYLQQLDMESNGKSTTRDGQLVMGETGPIVWGEPGTNGPPAFYQLIHQGTDIIPADFLIAANAHNKMGDHHEKLVANCLAQSEALMVGKTLDEVMAELLAGGMEKTAAKHLAPHKVFPGNRPSSTFMFPKLTPHILGQLIALYEHKVFVQGVIWNINSFDQWGVELGKTLAGKLLPIVKGEEPSTEKDASTKGLLERYFTLKS